MSDSKMDYSIGHLRMKYLHSANETFAQGNYVQTDGYLKAFTDTIPDVHPCADMIKEEYDNIMLRRKAQMQELQDQIKNMGYLESKDTENRGREEIEINTIHDKKVVCWKIGLHEGLFYE